MFPVTGAIFANGTVSVHSLSPCSLARGARRSRAYRGAKEGRVGDRRVTLYVSYSEMFMRPVQRPITKMTIKINYSHHAAIATGLLAAYNAEPASSIAVRIRDAEIVGGTNQFT